MKLQNKNKNKVDPHNQYARDYFNYMLDKEMTMSPILFRSPQLHLRPLLTRWLKGLNDMIFRLERSTLFLALRFLDTFMDQYDVAIHRLYAVALACLDVAAKHEETESSLPKFTQLVDLLKAVVDYPKGCEMNKKALCDIEFFVLKFLNGRLFSPTVSHFTDFFTYLAVTDEDAPASKTDVAVTKKAVSSLVEKILDSVFLGPFTETALNLTNCRPSCVAAAVILVARAELGISPVWPDGVARATDYTKRQLQTTARMIKKVWTEKRRKDEDRDVKMGSVSRKGSNKKQKLG